jgi:Cd2+/Zn2+-exporting ATPase
MLHGEREINNRMARDSDTTQATSTLDVRVARLDCDSDAAKIDRAFRQISGVDTLSVRPTSGRVIVQFHPELVSADQLRDHLRTLGFPVHAGTTGSHAPRLWRNPKVITSGISGLLLLIGWLIERAGANAGITTPIFVASLLIGGYYFGREAIDDLLHERQVGIELLMSIAAVVATVMGAPLEGAMLAFLYSMSEAAEGYTGEKTRAAVQALMDLTPKTALVRRERDGTFQDFEIPVEELRVGDVFIVKPGQSMPTDGEVVAGTSSVNQAPVTGESIPLAKEPGHVVFAGTINGDGALDVRATKAFAENTIARIIHMVEDAQERKGTSERFIERFGRRYSPLVLALGIGLAIVPPVLLGASWESWIMRATVFIVAAAPCALVISIPITLVAALGTGARNGVLIKGGMYLEELARIRVVALDKTGTITNGTPDVTDFIRMNASSPSEHEILARTAGVEARSQHPLAQAVTRYVVTRGIEPAPASDFQAVTGAGATAQVHGQSVYVGSPTFFEEHLGLSLTIVQAQVEQLQHEGKTVIVVGDAQSVWALLAIRDNVRSNTTTVICALRDVGIRHVVMLTGDNERTAAAIAHEVGIDTVYANLSPKDKSTKVRELAAQYGRVAMVGDGVNDAPALAEATVGVAMGAVGTDVALETADVALMADDLGKLVYAFHLAQRNQRIVRQNLVLSVLVIGVLVVGAIAGTFTLPIAVIGHEMSEFIVIASGLRMVRS